MKGTSQRGANLMTLHVSFQFHHREKSFIASFNRAPATGLHLTGVIVTEMVVEAPLVLKRLRTLGMRAEKLSLSVVNI